MLKNHLPRAWSCGAGALALLLLAAPVSFADNGADAGSNKRALFGPNELRDGLYTPSIEEFLKRAYPSADVPAGVTNAARNGWAALNRNEASDGRWQLIGPSIARVPGVLNSLGDSAPYITAGRVTAMALAPSCSRERCRLYVAAAGGGIWRTNHALGTESTPHWEFVSGSFGTNAIGSLLLDPNDPTGNTLYAATGEENAAVDSEAGVGIYKTSDGGDTWTLVPGSDVFFQRSLGKMALDSAGNLLVPIGSGVRGVSSTDGGASSSGATGHPLATRGLYRQTGSTFTLIWPSPTPARGSTRVQVDPTHPGIIYVNAFQHGIWRSTDNGTTFSQIFSPQDPTVAGAAIDRSEFDVTTLPNGATRMYVGEGQGGGAGHLANFWRSDNADTAATFAQFGGAQVDDYCTGQCWYDNVVYTPAGFPDVVYLLGSFSYGQLGGISNGRAVLLSSDAGAHWSDLTQDGDPSHAEFTHPDQHAIATLPGNPYLYWEGSDGGVVRTDGTFSDVSFKCDGRGLNAADTAFCKSLLSRVPHELANNINRGFSTLQFQSLSVSPQHPRRLIQGGTQDNGTWQIGGTEDEGEDDAGSAVWHQIIYGDGGQSGFSSTNDAIRFNTFTGQANDANFHGGDPTKWVIISAPIFNSPEGAFFYPPVIADPHPANGGTIFQGSFSVWRTQDWGGDRAFLEANCPEFTTFAGQADCGDFVTIGPPGATDLTDNLPASPVYGTSRIGSAVAWIQRTPSNTGTLWVATGAGRVFISDNANAAAGSVVWNRVDPVLNDPSRFISSIVIDPVNPHHAWISYSGYNVNTRATPGHVFEVTWTGAGLATWVDRSFNLPDFPITGLAHDDVTGDLYASSDFGVLKLPSGSTTWVVAGSGLPNVEVAGLTIASGERVLYAATHGRSAWSLTLR
ncbi:MAG: WD40/YVTN/BNR-like repeat-containing protein [Steroidobacteraceae bacterium]